MLGNLFINIIAFGLLGCLAPVWALASGDSPQTSCEAPFEVVLTRRLSVAGRVRVPGHESRVAESKPGWLPPGHRYIYAVEELEPEQASELLLNRRRSVDVVMDRNGKWTVTHTIEESKAEFTDEVTLPSLQEFQRKYPHTFADLSRAQTVLRFEGVDYLLESYDEKTGEIGLLKDYVDYGKIGDKVFGITLTDEIARAWPGKVISDETGENSAELISYNAHGSKKAVLRRRERLIVPFRTFEILLASSKISVRRFERGGRDFVESRVKTPLKMSSAIFPNARRVIEVVGWTHMKELPSYRQHRKVEMGKGDDIELVERYCNIYTFRISTKRTDHDVEVVIPRLWNASENRYWHREARFLVSQLPLFYANAVDRITLVPDHETLKWGGRAVVDETEGGRLRAFTIWKNNLKRPVSVDTVWHETGHLIVEYLMGTFTPLADWRAAMVRDGQPPSSYAQANLREDIAETFELYMKTDAGRLSSDARRKYGHRFAVIDRYFGVDSEVPVDLTAIAAISARKSWLDFARSPSLFRKLARSVVGMAIATLVGVDAAILFDTFVKESPAEEFWPGATYCSYLDGACSALPEGEYTRQCFIGENATCIIWVTKDGESKIVDLWVGANLSGPVGVLPIEPAPDEVQEGGSGRSHD